jgi:hypothetical protein
MVTVLQMMREMAKAMMKAMVMVTVMETRIPMVMMTEAMIKTRTAPVRVGLESFPLCQR